MNSFAKLEQNCHYKWLETFNSLIMLVENKTLHLTMPDCEYDLSNIKKAVEYVESSIVRKGWMVVVRAVIWFVV